MISLMWIFLPRMQMVSHICLSITCDLLSISCNEFYRVLLKMLGALLTFSWQCKDNSEAKGLFVTFCFLITWPPSFLVTHFFNDMLYSDAENIRSYCACIWVIKAEHSLRSFPPRRCLLIHILKLNQIILNTKQK